VASGSDHFVLLESENPDPAGPVLVDSGAAAQIRKDEAQGLLDQARSSAGAGDYERALGLLEDISSDYADVSSVCAAAKREADNCRLKLGEALYEKARDAVERTKDFTAALRWLDMIEKEYARGGKLQEKAEKLRETTLAALDKNRNELRYQTLLTNMGKALDRGDLPQAEKLLADLKALVAEGFEPSEGGGGSQQAEAYYAGRLADAQAKFSIDKKVLESHLKQGNYEQAREKVEEIKERFPEHPEIAELEDLLAAEPAGP
jgi:tetratricopeptide (TPR) repeat protein